MLQKGTGTERGLHRGTLSHTRCLFSGVPAPPKRPLQSLLRMGGELRVRGDHGAARCPAALGARLLGGHQHISSREEVAQTSSESLPG